MPKFCLYFENWKEIYSYIYINEQFINNIFSKLEIIKKLKVKILNER